MQGKLPHTKRSNHKLWHGPQIKKKLIVIRIGPRSLCQKIDKQQVKIHRQARRNQVQHRSPAPHNRPKSVLQPAATTTLSSNPHLQCKGRLQETLSSLIIWLWQMKSSKKNLRRIHLKSKHCEMTRSLWISIWWTKAISSWTHGVNCKRRPVKQQQWKNHRPASRQSQLNPNK